jgi:hypothetical protein
VEGERWRVKGGRQKVKGGRWKVEGLGLERGCSSQLGSFMVGEVSKVSKVSEV